MNNRRFVFGAVLAGMLFLPLAAHAQYQSSITFENGTGWPAPVKLVGFCDREGYCSYMPGDPSSRSYRFCPGFLRFSLDSGGPCILEPQRREP